jgi:hypothetical protein
VISLSSKGFRDERTSGAADVATQERPDGEGKTAAATAVSIPDFKNPRRFGLEVVLDLLVWFMVFDLLVPEFQNSNGKSQMANVLPG